MVCRISLVVYLFFLVAPGAGANETVTAVADYSLTPERLGAVAALLAGLVGVVVGGVALARSQRGGSTIALSVGLASMALGGAIVATADGGLGTGNGLGGGVIAMLLGAVSVALGGLARVRSRRAD